jgi:NAD(P)-dependent dehydrogenase (short-subunit alcohol dehydrogenase family)
VKIEQSIALVTGASSGIGLATARRLVEAGYVVYGTSRRGGQASGERFRMLPLDVTKDDSVEAAVKEILRHHGRIDLLVNNAGFGVAPGGAEESSMDQAKAIFETNFFGLIRMTRAVLPQMRRQGYGRIVNIGSVVGFLPAPYGALYSATKHAVEGYSESLDHEVRAKGIRVSVVEPAYTKTHFDANLMSADESLTEYRDMGKQVEAALKKAIGGGDDPSVVAAVVLEAATAARPKVRYTAGRLATTLRLLRRFAPASLIDSAIRKDLGLDAPMTAPPKTRGSEQVSRG